ncbi:heparinase II/III domain-containing protein [Microlunatus soli]|uniref:Heparinase II/III-like protein n=1 Tax=Microlunatus soli TaxID=630515 RepID=A0A1H1TVW3_9ACTN|nr:heparinase II/III family protein [Microlunatus soli]SDS64423.1 Heparinase II/III-like protein [Microlunatus soli]
MLDFLTCCADRYLSLPGDHDGAQGWMLAGRLFHQALTEAIWAVNIGQAAWTLHDHRVTLPTAVTELLAELTRAAVASRATLLDQDRSTSNYLAWLDAAGAVCSRDEQWLSGDHGIYPHLLAATLSDGWQWEASTYYHSFVLRACLIAIANVPGAVPPPEVAERLRAMHQVLRELRSPGGELPALHDGPYRRDGYDQELAELDLDETDRATVGAPATITVQPDGGYAILSRPGLHAILAFGPHGGSHGHFDKLSLSLYGRTTSWQADPGQVPYGNRFWRRHYASTAAHPTVIIDDTDQSACTGSLLGRDDDSVTVGCDTAYPGVRITRTLRHTVEGLDDEVTVRCDRPRRVALQLRPVGPVDTLVTADGFSTVWHGSSDAEVLMGSHQATGPAQPIVRPGPGPADDPQREVPQIDWIAEDCREITFTSHYRVAPPLEGDRAANEVTR